MSESVKYRGVFPPFPYDVLRSCGPCIISSFFMCVCVIFFFSFLLGFSFYFPHCFFFSGFIVLFFSMFVQEDIHLKINPHFFF